MIRRVASLLFLVFALSPLAELGRVRGAIVANARFGDPPRAASTVRIAGYGLLPPSAAWTAVGDQGWASFARAVRSAGDVNGDGYADVVVGASGYDDGFTDEGAAFVYLWHRQHLPLVFRNHGQ